MKAKLAELASKAKEAAAEAVEKSQAFVASHEDDIARLKKATVSAAKAASDTALEAGREMAESRAFKDAAKGAAIGAVAAVPVPFVGPLIGAVVGAGAGVFLGQKNAAAAQTLQRPHRDLHDELLKLSTLLENGLLTQAEFDSEKKKLLKAS